MIILSHDVNNVIEERPVLGALYPRPPNLGFLELPMFVGSVLNFATIFSYSVGVLLGKGLGLRRLLKKMYMRSFQV